LTKKNWNRTETGSNRPVSVRFNLFFRKKTGSNRFWLGFLGFGLVFSGFGSVFSVLARFFRFGSVLARFFSVSVRFGFFGFLLIKPNRTGRFFQNFNRFFFRFGFFGYFFSSFLGLIGFSVFLLTPRYIGFEPCYEILIGTF